MFYPGNSRRNLYEKSSVLYWKYVESILFYLSWYMIFIPGVSLEIKLKEKKLLLLLDGPFLGNFILCNYVNM